MDRTYYLSPVTVLFRAATEVHAALPSAARRPGGAALTIVGASGPTGADEPLVCRVGGGAEERAVCVSINSVAPSSLTSSSSSQCGGRRGGALVARCPAPPSSGDAFDVLTLGFGAETSVRGNSGEVSANVASGGGVEIEYTEDPLAIFAVPAAAPATGGVRVILSGAPDSAWSFGGGASGCTGGVASGAGSPAGPARGVWCLFGAVAVPAVVFSSVLAACEAPGVPEGAVVLEAALAGGMGSGGGGGGTGQQRVSFSHVTPVATVAVTPSRADWLSSPVLTVAGRGFAANLEGLHCRVGVVGPVAVRWVSGVEVQCTAPAHAGRRTAPVAVLMSISMAPAMPSFRGHAQHLPPTLLPVVHFEIRAEHLDPRGRPGGRTPPLGIGIAQRGATHAAATVAAAVLYAASPGSTTGSVPILVAGMHLTAGHGGGGECWCLFGEYAALASRVSSALLRCAEAPPADHEAAAASLRLACAWGMYDAAAIAAADASDVEAGVEANVVGAALAVGGGRLPITLLARPRLEAVTPMRTPARGGVTVTLSGAGFHARGDGGAAMACRFGAVGPIAAQHLSPHEVQCVTPASLGGTWVPVGVTPNNGAEYQWGGTLDNGIDSGSPVIFVDTLLLLSLDGSVGVAMPPGGPARGNTPIELFHVAGRLAPPPPPPGLDGGGSRGGGGRGGGWSGRGSGQYVSFSAGAPCGVFSDASVTTSGQWHECEGAASLWSVRCFSPSRLVAGGFEAVRVRVHGVGVADTSAQFLVHADARVC